MKKSPVFWTVMTIAGVLAPAPAPAKIDPSPPAAPHGAMLSPTAAHCPAGSSARPALAAAHTDLLLRAICQVESQGGKMLVGDDGRSLGPYQIGRKYWHDGCAYGGVRWPYEGGVFDGAKCRRVIMWYWACYGATTDEARARLHNGGPDGMSNPHTLAYWHKVRAELRALERP